METDTGKFHELGGEAGKTLEKLRESLGEIAGPFEAGEDVGVGALGRVAEFGFEVRVRRPGEEFEHKGQRFKIMGQDTDKEGNLLLSVRSVASLPKS